MQSQDVPLPGSVVALKLGGDRLDKGGLVLVGHALPLSDPLLDVGGRKADRVEVLVGDRERDERVQRGESEGRRGGEKVVQVGETEREASEWMGQTPEEGCRLGGGGVGVGRGQGRQGPGSHLVLGPSELPSLVRDDSGEDFGVDGCELGGGDGVDREHEGEQEVEEALDLWSMGRTERRKRGRQSGESSLVSSGISYDVVM